MLQHCNEKTLMLSFCQIYFILPWTPIVIMHPQVDSSTTEHIVEMITEDPSPHQRRASRNVKLLRPECATYVQEEDNSNSNRRKIGNSHNLIYNCSHSSNKLSLFKHTNWQKSSNYSNHYNFINRNNKFNYDKCNSHTSRMNQIHYNSRTAWCSTRPPPTSWTQSATTEPTLSFTTTVTNVAAGFE